MPDTADDREATGPEADSGTDPEAEAFAALGNGVRTAALRALAAAGPLSFSDLHDRVPAETSAGFAYHLRTLDGRFVRETDEGYELTDAGRRVARAVRAGVLTDAVDRAPVDLPDPCPHCGAPALAARCADNRVRVACGDCERPVLALPFPPGGWERPDAEALRAFDRHHRHRVATLASGVCPECAGPVDCRPEDAGESGLDRGTLDGDGGDTPHGEDATDYGGGPGPSDGPAGASARVRFRFACEGCGLELACPPTLAALDHPAVAGFYRDHGVDLRERPLWNVGPEWRETVLSTDPFCVRVATELDGDALALFLDADGDVRAVQRGGQDAEADPATASQSS